MRRVHVAMQLGASLAHDGRRPDGAARVDHDALQPCRQAGVRGVGVRDGDALEAVVPDDVHGAPVRQRRHGEP